MKIIQMELSCDERNSLLETLQARFEGNQGRHKGITWAKVKARLEVNLEKLWSLRELEATGGEPDGVDLDKKTGERLFLIDVVGYDWNGPKYLTPRYTAREVEKAVAPLHERIAELEAQLQSRNP